jgi:hypothetical protein
MLRLVLLVLSLWASSDIGGGLDPNGSASTDGGGGWDPNG